MNTDCSMIITLTGRVQGVGFRYHARHLAQELGLVGYIKNQPDESVLIVIQGSPDLVRAFLEWCKQGPPRAIVESMNITDHPISTYSAFKIC